MKNRLYSFFKEITNLQAPECATSSQDELCHDVQLDTEINDLTLFMDEIISVRTTMVGIELLLYPSS